MVMICYGLYTRYQLRTVEAGFRGAQGKEKSDIQARYYWCDHGQLTFPDDM